MRKNPFPNLFMLLEEFISLGYMTEGPKFLWAADQRSPSDPRGHLQYLLTYILTYFIKAVKSTSVCLQDGYICIIYTYCNIIVGVTFIVFAIFYWSEGSHGSHPLTRRGLCMV